MTFQTTYGKITIRPYRLVAVIGGQIICLAIDWRMGIGFFLGAMASSFSVTFK